MIKKNFAQINNLITTESTGNYINFQQQQHLHFGVDHRVIKSYDDHRVNIIVV